MDMYHFEIRKQCSEKEKNRVNFANYSLLISILCYLKFASTLQIRWKARVG